MSTRAMRRLAVVFAAAGLACLATARPVQAAMRLELSTTSGAFVSLTDGDGDGIISFTNVGGPSFGSFNIQITTGFSKPAIGSPSDPQLDILNASIVNVAGASDTLTIRLTDTGFTQSEPGELTLGAGGTAVGGISRLTFQAFKGTTEFGNELVSTSLLDFNPPAAAFSGMTSQAHGGLPASYSMSLVATVTTTGAVGSTTFDTIAKNPVPEPATIAMAITGAPLLGLLWLRRRAKA